MRGGRKAGLLPQMGLLPNVSILPTHPFIAEVSPSSVLQHLVPQPRGLGLSLLPLGPVW